eukprot:6307487-Amphidinium_carterae.1
MSDLSPSVDTLAPSEKASGVDGRTLWKTESEILHRFGESARTLPSDRAGKGLGIPRFSEVHDSLRRVAVCHFNALKS